MSSFAGRRIVVATNNPGKVREFAEILASRDFTLCDLADLPSVHFPAEGSNYAENAIAKARTAAEQLGEIALADDSGLEVEGLGGKPGPLSARFGGSPLDDAGRVAYLLAELAKDPTASRRARFVCYAALATPRGQVESAFGECAGTILETPRGASGFGYDPVFQLQGMSETMAELPAARKNDISHRARALRALFDSLP
jgi:XTP/dITP diphosphohydrolase